MDMKDAIIIAVQCLDDDPTVLYAEKPSPEEISGAIELFSAFLASFRADQKDTREFTTAARVAVKHMRNRFVFPREIQEAKDFFVSAAASHEQRVAMLKGMAKRATATLVTKSLAECGATATDIETALVHIDGISPEDLQKASTRFEGKMQEAGLDTEQIKMDMMHALRAGDQEAAIKIIQKIKNTMVGETPP